MTSEAGGGVHDFHHCLRPRYFTTAVNATVNLTVVPGIQDQADTDLVNALWVGGLGCPTAARIAPSGTFTDAACATGDNTDIDHQGLLLMKPGPTTNAALSGATIFGVYGITLTELALRSIFQELAWTQPLPELAHLIRRQDIPRCCVPWQHPLRYKCRTTSSLISIIEVWPVHTETRK